MRTVILALSIFLFSSISVKAVEVPTLAKSLEKIGIEQEHRENIEAYLKNLNISEKDINELKEEAQEVIGTVEDKNSISDFTLKEILEIYKKGNSMVKDLNLDLDINIGKKSFSIRDKKNNMVLLEANIKELKNYYDNYIQLLNTNSLEDYKVPENNLNIEKKIQEEGEKKLETFQKELSKRSPQNTIIRNKDNISKNIPKSISNLGTKKIETKKFSLLVATLFTLTTLAIYKIVKKA